PRPPAVRKGGDLPLRAPRRPAHLAGHAERVPANPQRQLDRALSAGAGHRHGAALMKTKLTNATVILSRADGEGSQAAQSEILRCAQDDGVALAALFCLLLVLLAAACQRSTQAQETSHQTPPNEV